MHLSLTVFCRVITLTLLHPHQSVPLKCWTFDRETIVRIGRAPDNHVVLYSAVVSRYHLELHFDDNSQWYLVNLGTNGTYLNDRRVEEMSIPDGAILRLARTGPQIQLHIRDASVSTTAQQALQQFEDRAVPEDDTTHEETPWSPQTEVVRDRPKSFITKPSDRLHQR